MSDKVLEKKKAGKFLFDVHNFDDDAEDDGLLQDNPPPPTFTVAEFENAKRAAFEQGKAEGQRQSEASREQQIALTLNAVGENFAVLFKDERRREKSYEAEAVGLALNMIRKLFPLMSAKFGLDELKHTMTGILQAHEGQKHIQIYVAPDMRDGIENHIEEVRRRGQEFSASVIADESLQGYACKMLWEDGGAVKDSHALAQDIVQALEQLLAAGKSSTGPENHPPAGEKAAENTGEISANQIESDMINTQDSRNRDT